MLRTQRCRRAGLLSSRRRKESQPSSLDRCTHACEVFQKKKKNPSDSRAFLDEFGFDVSEKFLMIFF